MNLKIPEIDNIFYRVNRDLSYKPKKKFKEDLETYARLLGDENQLFDQYNDLLEVIDYDWLEKNYMREPKEAIEKLETLKEETKRHKKELTPIMNKEDFIEDNTDYYSPEIDTLIKEIKSIKKEIEKQGIGNSTVLATIENKDKIKELRQKLREIKDVSMNKKYLSPELNVISIKIDVDPWIAEKGWD